MQWGPNGRCIGGPRVSLLTIVEDSAMRDVYYTTGRCKGGSQCMHGLDINYIREGCNGGPRVWILNIVEDDAMGASRYRC